MKKISSLILIFSVWAMSLSAQITREQADTIMREHLQNGMLQHCSLYVNINVPSEKGIIITTSNDEVVKAKYACWTYYLDEKENSLLQLVS